MVEEELPNGRRTDKNSGRRGFIRKLLGIAAVGSIGAVLYEKITQKPLTPLAYGADGTNVTVGNTVEGTNPSSNSTIITGHVTTAATFEATNDRSQDSSAGVRGHASAGTGVTYGVRGISDSTTGRGVYGYASVGTGPTYGVYGASASTSGIGVKGIANTSGTGVGVFGESTDFVGVKGSGGAISIWGTSPSVSTVPIVAQGTTGQTANLQEWRHVSGTALTLVDKDGKFGAGISSPEALFHAQAISASTKPIIAQGHPGQTANLQEWQNSGGTALSVVDAAGKLGVGLSAPVRQVHLQGRNAVFRMDRDLDSSAFMLVRTASGDFSTIWKTFYVGVNASGVNNGSFFIGDVGTNVSGPSTVRLAIDNSGNVGVGTESPGYLLDVAGQAHATSFPTSSDMRFKDEVAPLENVLERLEQIRGVTFEWNNRYASLGRATQGRQIGVIAQEVEKAFPELVSRWKAKGMDDCRAVDYGRFTAVLLEAIKELHGKLEEKSGDLVFENGVRATEEGRGLAFLNDTGEKIAVLDHKGNLQVKGKITENPNL